MSFDPYTTSNLDTRRAWNSNTWGFSRKIGDHTFGDYHYKTDNHFSGPTNHDVTWNVDDAGRAEVRNKLRHYTKILDIGGYIPGVSVIVGIIRIIAAAILGKFIERQIKAGIYVADLADEARRTYQAQIARGILEIIPVLGQIINLSLDGYWYSQWGKRPVGNLIK